MLRNPLLKIINFHKSSVNYGYSKSRPLVILRQHPVIAGTHREQGDHQPLVLSIEAPLGWGKSTFVKIWKSIFASENRPFMNFMAWNNDFSDDPLIAFISEMRSIIDYKKDGGKTNLYIRLFKIHGESEEHS